MVIGYVNRKEENDKHKNFYRLNDSRSSHFWIVGQCPLFCYCRFGKSI